jgi:hypothetical protein
MRRLFCCLFVIFTVLIFIESREAVAKECDVKQLTDCHKECRVVSNKSVESHCTWFFKWKRQCTRNYRGNLRKCLTLTDAAKRKQCNESAKIKLGDCKKNIEKATNSFLNKKAMEYCRNAKVGPERAKQCMHDWKARMTKVCQQRTAPIIAKEQRCYGDCDKKYCK